MRKVTQVARARVEMQGFEGLADENIRDIHYWIRLAPLISGVWTTVGLVLGSAVVVWALVPFEVVCATVARHPFNALYMRLVRPRTGAAPIPEYGAPRRFACAFSAVWLTATGALFFAGAPDAARLFGSVIPAIVAVEVATGYCIRCAVYRLTGRMRSALKRITVVD